MLFRRGNITRPGEARESDGHDPGAVELSAIAAESDGADERAEGGVMRREIVRAGVKLAFVAPVITTFLARDAMAAGSNHSCYPAGEPCGDGTLETCCPGTFCLPDGFSPTGSSCQ